jgi:hypothetical protein
MSERRDVEQISNPVEQISNPTERRDVEHGAVEHEARVVAVCVCSHPADVHGCSGCRLCACSEWESTSSVEPTTDELCALLMASVERAERAVDRAVELVKQVSPNNRS